MKIGLLDYGMGNLRSVVKAWEHVGATVAIISKVEDVEGLQALVFPGQGAIVDCQRRLKETGFDRAIREWVAADRPFFGICLGLQALFDHSEEGDTPGLGIFPGQVVRFRLPAPHKVPHMGWNGVEWRQNTPVESGWADPREQFYFVHSYYAVPIDASLAWGRTEYGGQSFVSAIRRGRCYATQFHPEKSQAAGLHLYRNFLKVL